MQKHKKLSPKQNNAKNPWLWILGGIFAGVLITSSILIKFNVPKQQLFPPQTLNEKTPTAVKQTIEAEENKSQVFDFYTTLPNMETATTTDAKKQENGQLATTPNSLPEKTTNIISKYLIQVNIFNKIDDADELKAMLTLNGFDAKIEPVQQGHHTNYRIVVGPFSTKEQAYDQQKLLAQQNIPSNLVKIEKN